MHRLTAYVPGELAVWPHLRGGEVLDLLGNLHESYDRAFRDELCQRFEFDPSKRGSGPLGPPRAPTTARSTSVSAARAPQ
ncbi:MAG TPA: hypothetical protein VI854_09555, partial [Acidimicrobiia bacterium]|nr:hypothetical protein [Acidimicrobiia bacterium]